MQLKVDYLGNIMQLQLKGKSLEELYQVLKQKTNRDKIKLFYQDELNDKIIISDQDDYDFFVETIDIQKVKLQVEGEIESDTEYLPKIDTKKKIYDFNGLELSSISQMGESERLKEEQIDLEREAIIQKHKMEVERR